MSEKNPFDQEGNENISDEACVEAMRAGDFERVKVWYAQQEAIASQDPTPKGHMDLTLKMAMLQHKAGLDEYALDTLDAAYQDAYQQGDDETAARIAAVMNQIKG